MGNGIMKKVPNLDEFNLFTKEYDKLKSAGLSTEEIHMILLKRFSEGANLSQHESNKENGIRISEKTRENSNEISKNLKISIPKPTPAPYLPKSEESLNSSNKTNESIVASNGLVLLIDDSPVAAKVATKVLSTLHFEVVSANSAKMGFDILIARRDEIILIFLDVVMPKVDGVECLSWIKENADVAHIPVYMLTGLEDQLLTDVCIERGAEGMILKPLNSKILKSIIKSHNIELKGLQLEDAKSPQNSNLLYKPRSLQISSQATVSSGSLAPAFKLTDSDFEEFTYPSSINKKKLFLVFFPTVFSPELYEIGGLLSSLVAINKMIDEKNITVVCVSTDLPYALSFAKDQFKIPFRLCSDPSLFVSQRFIGCFDFGSVYAKDLDNAENLQYKHPQNNIFGPNLGIVYLNRNREVLYKWTISKKIDKPEDLLDFPSNILAWDKLKEENDPIEEAKEQNQQDKSSAKKALSKPGPTSNSKSKIQILVVDDSSVSSRVACKKLESKGFSVFTAYNGQLAYDMLKKSPSSFSIILVDVVMPVCDGIELLKMMKEDNELNNIPVVMLSGLEGEELAKDCKTLGATALLKKPFEEYRFLEIMKKCNIISKY